MGSGPDVAANEFAAFDEPGFAKITLSLRVQPYGAEASILTLETRVGVTDPVSLKRFQRYWAVIGPFSHLVRWIALRLVAADLRHARRGTVVDRTGDEDARPIRTGTPHTPASSSRRLPVQCDELRPMPVNSSTAIDAAMAGHADTTEIDDGVTCGFARSTRSVLPFNQRF